MLSIDWINNIKKKKTAIKSSLEQDEKERHLGFPKQNLVSKSLTLLNMFNLLAMIRIFVIFIQATKNKL